MIGIKTKIVNVDPLDIEEKKMQQAAEIIKTGGTVAFPTETVYGLGANALDESAVKKIFKAKGRPGDNPLILHICDMNSLYGLAKNIPDDALKVCSNFWPGPITVILEKKNIIPDITTAGLKTAAFRMPADPVALSLIKLSKVPIAAPSANLSGRPSPTEFLHVKEDLDGKVNMIIDSRNDFIGLESTVLDLTGTQPVILRPGAVTKEQLESLLNKKVLYKESVIPNEDLKIPKAPGMKYRHYSPRAKMLIVEGDICKTADIIIEKAKENLTQKNKTGILATSQTLEKYSILNNAIVLNLGSREHPEEIAASLFYCLREFDRKNADFILSESFTDNGIFTAVRNRLYKAAGYNILKLSKILFVCTGNTCRSPMAEGFFNYLARKKGLDFYASSAGLHVSFPMSASPFAVNAVYKYKGIDIRGHVSHKITKNDAEKSDIILCMTSNHKNELISLYPGYKDKVFTLAEFADDNQNLSQPPDIMDPYGGNADIYDKCAHRIYELVEKTIIKLSLGWESV